MEAFSKGFEKISYPLIFVHPKRWTFWYPLIFVHPCTKINGIRKLMGIRYINGTTAPLRLDSSCNYTCITRDLQHDSLHVVQHRALSF